MKNTPKVSIIVPVYKVPKKYLEQCIESLCRQTLQEIEIILVDDGSPDNSGVVCDEYAKSESKIKVIHKPNGGLSSARNAGFESANGEWIMFVDGDDWIEPTMCEEMYNKAMEQQVQLVMCGIYKDFKKKSIEYKFNLEDNKVYQDEECKYLQQQLLVYNANIAVAYAKLIKKGLLQENNILHDEKLRQGAEGLEFNLKLFEKLEKAIFINKPFYHYMYNDTSISASHNEVNHEYVIKCFEKIKQLINESKNKDLLIPWFYNRLLYVIITTAISGYFNPTNDEPYRDKCIKYKRYLEKHIIKEALIHGKTIGLSKQRKMVLSLIKYRWFWVLDLLGKVRKYQKNHM